MNTMYILLPTYYKGYFNLVCIPLFLQNECQCHRARFVLEKYFRFEISLLSILCMLIAQTEMGTSRVSGDSDIIT